MDVKIQAYMLTGHATCSVTSRHSYASKSQDTTVKSVPASISYGTCSSMFTTNIAHGVGGYNSQCSDEMVIVCSLKFSSDPFGASRATWFVFAFLPCFVYCLLYTVFNLLIFCGVLQFLLFLFLFGTIFVRSSWRKLRRLLFFFCLVLLSVLRLFFIVFKIFFSPPLWFVLLRV